jgi:hypothetical protein
MAGSKSYRSFVASLMLLSLMLGRNLGLEIVAIHPNSEKIWIINAPAFVIPGREWSERTRNP